MHIQRLMIDIKKLNKMKAFIQLKQKQEQIIVDTTRSFLFVFKYINIIHDKNNDIYMQLSCILFEVVTTSGPLYLCVRVWVPGIAGIPALRLGLCRLLYICNNNTTPNNNTIQLTFNQNQIIRRSKRYIQYYIYI